MSDQQQPETAGRARIINVNSETGGQAPNQNPPSGNQQPPKQSGGGPEGAAVQDNIALNNAVAPQTDAQVPDNDDIDIEGMIKKSEAEVKTIDADQQARIDKQKYLMQAIDSRGYFERLLYNNIETGEVIGTKLKYIKDPYGKTVYDYMNDPVVTEHLEFLAAEGDPMDGSPVDKQVTFYWKKPTF